jgi:hypothetical protein
MTENHKLNISVGVLKVEMLKVEIKLLRIKNAKLKDALEFYANKDHWAYDEINPDDYDGKSGGELARKVLKELGK